MEMAAKHDWKSLSYKALLVKSFFKRISEWLLECMHVASDVLGILLQNSQLFERLNNGLNRSSSPPSLPLRVPSRGVAPQVLLSIG
jgi:hypothetical protein